MRTSLYLLQCDKTQLGVRSVWTGPLFVIADEPKSGIARDVGIHNEKLRDIES